jgi:hypothetical protein
MRVRDEPGKSQTISLSLPRARCSHISAWQMAIPSVYVYTMSGALVEGRLGVRVWGNLRSEAILVIPGKEYSV